MDIAPIALTDRQRRALAAIGIDVWVRRDVPVAPAQVVAELREEVYDVVQAPARSKPPAVVPTPAAMAELRINLDCVTAEGVVVIGECANPLDLRLAHDIVLAIAGMTTHAHKSQFRWPQTQTGDSSTSAARNAYRAFLRGQIERANARYLLLLGASAQLLVDPDAKLGPATMQLPDIRALRGDRDAKKQLWLNVSHRNPA